MKARLRLSAAGRTRLALVAALLAPLGLTAAFVPVRASFTNVGAALVLVALIESLAIIGNRLVGIVASLSAATWFDFFLAPPFERFTISRRPDLETTICILVVGIIVTELAARSRRHREVADQEIGYVALIHDVTALAAGTTPVGRVIEETSAALIDLLQLRACRFEPDVSGPPLARITLNGSVVHVGLHWPVTEIGIPGPEAEIACQWRGSTPGRFVLTPTPGLSVSREERLVAISLVNIVAGVLHDQRPAASS